MQYAPRLLTRLALSLLALPLVFAAAWLMAAARPTSYPHAADVRGVAAPTPPGHSYAPMQTGGVTSSGRTITVNTTADTVAVDGRCSLREALMAANGNRKINECSAGGAGLDTIKFSLSSGTPTISLNSPLPTLTEPVQILGNSGSSTRIELNGANAGAADGLTLAAGSGGSVIRSLVINRFNGAGIYIQSASGGNTVEDCFIGTDATGAAAAGNYFSGVEIQGSSNNRIGGLTPSDRNVIAGNGEAGVLISGAGATGNLIQANFIGTNVAGAARIPNGLSGIIIDGAANNVVGGTDPLARNVISGNGESGVFVNGVAATGNRVLGNYIGTDATGALAIANAIRGVSLDGAPNNTVGGEEAGARNVISGNQGAGVGVFGAAATGNAILGNFIGTDATGSVRLGNADFGVVVEDAPGNRVGGTTGAARNIISGNSEAGVIIAGAAATGNAVLGNFIGTNAGGTAAISNLGGVALDSASQNVIGGTDAGARNIISGNAGDGVVIGGGGQNRVENNFIGTDVTGLLALPNAYNGVLIVDSSNNTVGGLTAGKGNVIAFNRQSGVLVAPVVGTSAGNAIFGNAIFGNVLLGIDLSADPRDPFLDGPTNNDPGDADTGANKLQNFPVLTAVTSTGAVSGSLDSLPTFTAYPVRVEFFANVGPGVAGRGAGETFIGAATVSAPGNFTAAVSPVAGKPYVAATASDANGNTSEFSPAVKINAPPTVLASVIVQPAGSATRRQVATVNDADQAPGTLAVSVAPASGLGVTLTNVSVNAAGQVFADVTAGCAAINSTFTLTVRDNQNEAASAPVAVTVTPGLPPTLGAYAPQVVGQGASLVVTPGAKPSDDGGVANVTVGVSPGFGGQVRVNPATGAVSVTNANPPGNYTVTVTAADNCGLTASRSFPLTVDQVTTTIEDAATCLTAGATVKVVSRITHVGTTAASGALTVALPEQLAAVPNSCQVAPAVGACDTSSPQQLTWSGTLAPGQTVTVSYPVQVTAAMAEKTDLAVNAFANFGGGAAASYQVVQTVDCGTEPTTPPAATQTVSDDKPGSVLVFPVYSSRGNAPQLENTRINLTNHDTANAARLHFFFVNGVSGSIADSFLCLGPLQTTSFLVSDFDPGVSGYIVAVAVDADGWPTKFNRLTGSESVKLASGHAASLGATAFAAIADQPVARAAGATTATLKFDGVNYNAAPRTLALSNLPSPLDGNDTMLIVTRFGGDLSGQAAPTLGEASGLLFDADGNAYSFAFTGPQPQWQKTVNDSFPRTQPRWTTAITRGKSGWLLFGSKSNAALLGASLNKATNAASYSQGHNLHRLDLTTATTLVVPVMRPPCQ